MKKYESMLFLILAAALLTAVAALCMLALPPRVDVESQENLGWSYRTNVEEPVLLMENDGCYAGVYAGLSTVEENCPWLAEPEAKFDEL